MNVHLGFEVGTGKHISVPLAHTFVTGQTQLSGKTTTLQALVSRSAMRSLAFVTKRGEVFEGRRIRPFLPRSSSEPIHWRFVEVLLASALGSRNLKYERLWLINASKGAFSLFDVRKNVERLLSKSKGRSEEVYTLIREYLDLVIPGMRALNASEVLDLQPGLNVMNLSAHTTQLQALVIRAALERINRHENHVLVVFPEAWEFAPRGRSAPAKDEAIAMARKGAVLGNWLLCDSQDIAGVDENVRRQCSVWLLGVQRELNEVKRTLDMMPGGIRKPKADDIAGLGIGEFFACWGRHAVKVYVQPAWMDADEARAIALGELPVRRAAKGPVPSEMPAVSAGAPEVVPMEAVGDVLKRFVAKGQRAQNVAAQIAAHGPGLTFGELAIGEGFDWPAPIPTGNEAMVKTSPTTYAWSHGQGTAEEFYRVERWTGEEEEFMSAAAEAKLDEVLGALGRLTRALEANGALVGPPRDVDARRSPLEVPMPASIDLAGPDGEALVRYVIERVKAEAAKDPALLRVLVEQPGIEVAVHRATIEVDGDTLRGRLARLIVAGWFDETRTPGAIQEELRSRGFPAPAPNVARELGELARMGFLTRSGSKHYRAVEDMKRSVVEVDGPAPAAVRGRR